MKKVKTDKNSMLLLVLLIRVETKAGSPNHDPIEDDNFFVDDFSNLLLDTGKDIRVTGINDGQGRAVEEFSACSSKSTGITSIVVHLCLGKHGKVFNLRFSQVRAVVGDDDHLGLALAKSLEGSLVSEDSLSRLHDQLKSGVHIVRALLLYSIRKGKHVRYTELFEYKNVVLASRSWLP